jgi:tellurite resistance protein TerC
MLVQHWYKLPSELSLGVVALLIIGSVVASIVIKDEDEGPTPEEALDTQHRAHAAEGSDRR